MNFLSSFARISTRPTARPSGTATARVLAEVTLAAVVAAGFGIETLHAAPQSGPIQSGPIETGMRPRVKLIKQPVESLVLPTDTEGNRLEIVGTIVVKFRDDLRVRASQVASPEIASTTGGGIEDLATFSSILGEYKATVRQWINRTPEQLAALEARAAAKANRAQPDLASIVEIFGLSDDQLVEVARRIHGLDAVEFTQIPVVPIAAQCGDPAAPPCEEAPAGNPPFFEGCVDDACCQLVTGIPGFEYCADYNENPGQTGWDASCAAVANMRCSSTPYNLENPDRPDPSPGFTYDPCFYDGGNPPDFFNEAFEDVYGFFQTASCAVPHSTRGCATPACCRDVCTVDPSCCEDSWDQNCANYVLEGLFVSCPVIPTPGEDSPNLVPQDTGTGLQGYQYYIQSRRRAQIPTEVVPGFTWLGSQAGINQPLSGLDAQGLALQEFENFQNLIWQYYQNGEPGTNPHLGGQGIRIGVVDTSAYLNHEEFLLSAPADNPVTFWDGPLLAQRQVRPEPGQTPILVNKGNISVDHGTMVLGTILAADNGFGVTGVAPKARGYFFPTVSIEEGFRAQNAIVSALETFEQGDVLCFPWARGGGNIVTSDAAYWALIRLGSDLGVTSVLAAGQDGPAGVSVTVPDSETGEGSGAVLVSGVLPGNILPDTFDPGFQGGFAGTSRPWPADQDLSPLLVVRAGALTAETNYTPPADANADETVVTSGWAFAVATTGIPNGEPGGALFLGRNDVPPFGDDYPGQADRLRSYTQLFGGTSAASAMIAGCVARVQNFAQQLYGSAITPEQVAGVLSGTNFAQFGCSGQDGEDISLGPDTCNICIPFPCEDPVFHDIGGFPNMEDAVVAVLTGDFFDGNEADIRVISGLRVPGFTFSSFLIKADDDNYLRMETVRRQAGTVQEELAYLSSGATTDVLVEVKPPFENPSAQIYSIGIDLSSLATRNFTLMGVFIYNFEQDRYEFFGAELLTQLEEIYQFDIPTLGDYSAYLNPANDHIRMRVWTCGLGQSRSHEIWHDLMQIRINDPLIPVP